MADPDAAQRGVRTYKSVDTCAAEFAARTPYYYSAWERDRDDEVDRGERPSVVILGSGPNRIGQGIEFDYCCVHAAETVREQGRDAVMINCNPETVSTDYDTSDRLYFEPLTLEDVLAVCEIEDPAGVIVQFGGQTPLKLAAGLKEAGVPILGTSVDAIDLAEDRSRFGPLLDDLGYKAPPYATATSPEDALEKAHDVGFPLLVRPSYVLGGRAMEIVYSVDGLADYLGRVVPEPGAAIYLDRFLEDSIEVDVDALCDGTDVWIAGVMQHVEEAGIHSGDSACVLPPHTLGTEMLGQIRAQTEGIARALGVVGLLNVQFAIREDVLYVIEANPRASRTVPFVSKAIGLPVAKLACRVLLGERLADLDLPPDTTNGHVCVKEVVLPFDRFAGADSLLGPEMRSTGEVMGIARDFPTAFAKAQAAAGAQLPNGGRAFITVADGDKPAATGIATILHDLGFEIVATRGTAQAIRKMGIPAETINKIGEGSPHVVDWIERGEVDLVINTPVGTGARADGWEIRSAAIARGHPVRHHDDRGDSGRPRDRRRSARRAGGALAPGDPPPPRERGEVTRVTAPFGRRAAPVTAREEHGAYVVIRCRDADGPVPRPGQFYMLTAAERWGGGDGERPFLPRAFSVLRASAGELQFLIEDVGPGTKRLCELQPGERASAGGPAREWVRAAARGPRPAARRRRRRDRAARDLAGRARERGDHARSGSATPPTLPGPRSSRAHASVTDDGSVGHHGLVTELLEDELDDRGDDVEVYACGPPPMLEAVRAICTDHDVPAQLALESGMACGFGACFGCVVPTVDGYVRLCVDGPVLQAALLETALVAGAGH